MTYNPYKQILYYFIVSILIVVFASYGHTAIIYLDVLYTYINVQIMSLFHSHQVAPMLLEILSLAMLPILLIGIPAGCYRLIRKKTMPYTIELIWFVWLILALSKVLIY